MTSIRANAGSAYMDWAKLHSASRHNLATSGMVNLPLAELGVDLNELEINGPTIYGYEPLLEAIARRYRVTKDNVATAMGTSFANYLALAAITEPGDEVLIEQPAYDPIVGAARYLGLEIKRFLRRPEEDFAVDEAAIERQLTPRTRAIVLCNMHNPSGALTPDSVLREVGELAARSGAFVVVDEVYREMLFEAEPASAFHVDPARFIVTNSLTKAYGLSGLRCGWILAPAEIVRRIWSIHDVHAATYPFMPEYLSVAAFARLPEIAGRMKALLNENRRLLFDFLSSRDELEYVWPDYGTIVFPRLKDGNVDEFCRLLKQDFDVSLVPGRFFEQPEHFRMGVGTPTQAVREALDQFAAGLDRYRALHLTRTRA
jgi:aspartate/methionine/tyrosine aminotransferase